MQTLSADEVEYQFDEANSGYLCERMMGIEESDNVR